MKTKDIRTTIAVVIFVVLAAGLVLGVSFGTLSGFGWGDFSLLCPPAYVSAYSNMEDDLRRSIRSTQYQFGDIRFDKLERPRSLMDVFRSLPYKRTGVDVRV